MHWIVISVQKNVLRLLLDGTILDSKKSMDHQKHFSNEHKVALRNHSMGIFHQVGKREPTAS